MSDDIKALILGSVLAVGVFGWILSYVMFAVPVLP